MQVSERSRVRESRQATSEGTYLDNEKNNGIIRIVLGWVEALKDTGLRRRPVTAVGHGWYRDGQLWMKDGL